jgi:hypothetical protein
MSAHSSHTYYEPEAQRVNILIQRNGELIEMARRTFEMLAKYQGPHGEIPSNVDPSTGRISYSGTTGRVDGDLWFIIGCGEYWQATGHESCLGACPWQSSSSGAVSGPGIFACPRPGRIAGTKTTVAPGTTALAVELNGGAPRRVARMMGALFSKPINSLEWR